MVIPAARRRPAMPMYGRGYGQTAVEPSVSQRLMDLFKSTLSGLASPGEMYKAESAPVESSFEEAGEKMRSRLSALGGGGNVRAIQAGEERLAKAKSETLGKLRSEIDERAMSRQLLSAQLLKILRELGGGGGFQGAGPAYYGR